MTFLQLKKLLFEAYIEYLDIVDPLERAKLGADIKELIRLAKEEFSEASTGREAHSHVTLSKLFDLYDQYHQAAKDPLKKAHLEFELKTFLSTLEDEIKAGEEPGERK